jgi:hypothetical protein
MATPSAARYAAQFGRNLSASLDAIADGAMNGWRDVLAAADSSHHGTGQLRQEAVADAMDAGADWWALGQVLRLHPQAAFDRYANLRESALTPVQQRPQLAVLLTAGLVDVHRPCGVYGVDLDELSSPGFDTEPGVRHIRAAATLLGQRVWIRGAFDEKTSWRADQRPRCDPPVDVCRRGRRRDGCPA